MKTVKALAGKIVASCMSAVLVVSLLPTLALGASANETIFTVDGIRYSWSSGSAFLNDGEISVIGADSSALDDDGTLIIPERVEHDGVEYTVSYISSSDNYPKSSVTKVILPNTMRAIGSGTFTFFPNLSTVVIPEGVETLGTAAFRCSGLESIEIPSSCTAIPAGATIYSGGCFEGCSKLHTVILHEGLERIDNWAFNGCSSLREIAIPASVTSIGDDRAFGECTSLESISVAVGNESFKTIDGALYDAAQTTLLAYPVKRLETQPDYVAPEGVSCIAGGVFKNCSSLESVKLSDNAGICKIGYFAFYGCSALKKVTIPAGSKDSCISNYAFTNCTGLQSVVFTEGDFGFIGSYAFQNCTSLEKVDFSRVDALWGTAEGYSISGYAFQNCSSLVSLDIPPLVRTRRAADYYDGYGATSYKQRLAEYELAHAAYEERCQEYEACEQVAAEAQEAYDKAVSEEADADTLAFLQEALQQAQQALDAAATLKEEARTESNRAFMATQIDVFTGYYMPYWHSSTGPCVGAGILEAAFAGCTSLERIVFRAGCDIGMFSYFLGGNSPGTSASPNENYVFYNCTNLKSIVCEAAQPYFMRTTAGYNGGSQYFFNNWKAVYKTDEPKLYYAVDYYASEEDAKADDSYGSARLARVEYARDTSVAAISQNDTDALAEATCDRSWYAQSETDGELAALDPDAVAEAQGLGEGPWCWMLSDGQQGREQLSESCKAFLVKADDLLAARVASPELTQTQLLADRHMSRYEGRWGEFDPECYYSMANYKETFDYDDACWFALYGTGVALGSLKVYDAAGTEVDDCSMSLQSYDPDTDSLSPIDINDVKETGPYLATFTSDSYSGAVKRWLLIKKHTGSVKFLETQSAHRSSVEAAYAYGNVRNDFAGDYSILVGGGDATSGLIAAALAGLGNTNVQVTESAADFGAWGNGLHGTVLTLGNQDALSSSIDDALRSKGRYTNVERYGQASAEGNAYGPAELAVRTYQAFDETRYNGDYGSYACDAAWGDTAILCAPGEVFDTAAIASYAYTLKAPVLFTEDDGSLGARTLSYIKGADHITKLVIIGDASAVPEAVQTTLESELGAQNVVRLDADQDDACGLSITLASMLLEGNAASPSVVAIADGRDPLDAVAAQNLAGAKNGITFVTTSTADSKRIAAFLRGYADDIDFVRIYGRDATLMSNDAFDLESVLKKLWDENTDFDALCALQPGDTFVIDGAQLVLNAAGGLDMTGVFYSESPKEMGEELVVGGMPYHVDAIVQRNEPAPDPEPTTEPEDEPADISEASISVKSQVYTGKALKPAVAVHLGTATLKMGTDYRVAYSANTNPGTARVTVTGCGSYTGSAAATFEIKLPAAKLKKPKRAKKGFKASWMRVKSGNVSYQLRYSLKKSMKKAKTKTIKKNAKTTLVVKKLKAKKTYYLQVRTCKKIGGKTYYGAWSAKKKVKTK